MVEALGKRKDIRLLLIAAGSVLLAWLPWELMLRTPPSRGLYDATEAQVLVVAAVLTVRKHWKVAIAVSLLSPLHIRFWESTYRYARGEAYYIVPYTMYLEANLLDDRRIPMLAVGSASHTLTWWLWDAPQNAAVDICFAAFGAMPGAYDGPLPSWLDIRTSVADSHLDVDLAAVQRGSIKVGDALVQVRPDVGPRMIKVAMDRIPEESCLSTMRARVALWRERVLVVAMPWERNCTEPKEESKAWFSFAASIDARSGRVLGYYELERRMGNEADGLAGIWLLNNYGSVD